MAAAVTSAIRVAAAAAAFLVLRKSYSSSVHVVLNPCVRGIFNFRRNRRTAARRHNARFLPTDTTPDSSLPTDATPGSTLVCTFLCGGLLFAICLNLLGQAHIKLHLTRVPVARGRGRRTCYP